MSDRSMLGVPESAVYGAGFTAMVAFAGARVGHLVGAKISDPAVASLLIENSGPVATTLASLFLVAGLNRMTSAHPANVNAAISGVAAITLPLMFYATADSALGAIQKTSAAVMDGHSVCLKQAPEDADSAEFTLAFPVPTKSGCGPP